ncbi:MAG: hypothetical protein GTN59_14005, partial [Candidatus Dadabacteria bacterium]|nr:hypothetical protein [Candidatus Dadabacteria bacterium]
ENFIKREILSADVPTRSKIDLSTLVPDYKGCCGTIHTEHTESTSKYDDT